MNCPHCQRPIPDHVIRSEASRMAGSAKGARKARTTTQARAAAARRWSRATSRGPRRPEGGS